MCGWENRRFREEVIKALENAQCGDIIGQAAQGSGYSDRDEGGVYLSGGEQQRIAIARVMLKNARSSFWTKPRPLPPG